MVAIRPFWYNFVRIRKTLRVTPAMADQNALLIEGRRRPPVGGIGSRRVPLRQAAPAERSVMALYPETLIEAAERRVRQTQGRVLRQIQMVAELEALRHWDTARLAREFLAILTDSLDAAKVHLAKSGGISVASFQIENDPLLIRTISEHISAG